MKIRPLFESPELRFALTHHSLMRFEGSPNDDYGAVWIENISGKSPNYMDVIVHRYTDGTGVFEWCSRRNVGLQGSGDYLFTGLAHQRMTEEKLVLELERLVSQPFVVTVVSVRGWILYRRITASHDVSSDQHAQNSQQPKVIGMRKCLLNVELPGR